MRSIVLCLTLASILAGCGAVGTMTDGFKRSQEVATDLERSVGVRPDVGFKWVNGSLVVVSINFQGIPPGIPVEQLAKLSRQSVAARFNQAPKQVVISFAVPGS